MHKRFWLIILATVLLLTAIGWTSYGQRQRAAATNWEYKVVYSPGERSMTERKLNELGSQGWELVACQQINQEGVTIGAGNYYFKRAK
jgi:hypothetical protein